MPGEIEDGGKVNGKGDGDTATIVAVSAADDEQHGQWFFTVSSYLQCLPHPNIPSIIPQSHHIMMILLRFHNSGTIN